MPFGEEGATYHENCDLSTPQLCASGASGRFTRAGRAPNCWLFRSFTFPGERRHVALPAPEAGPAHVAFSFFAGGVTLVRTRKHRPEDVEFHRPRPPTRFCRDPPVVTRMRGGRSSASFLLLLREHSHKNKKKTGSVR